MKRWMMLILSLVLCLSMALPAAAADGKVTYSGNSGDFIFEPGSRYSPTDLFPNFKEVMPGDRLTQRITVENKANKKIKVRIYIRALGAQPGSEEFLSHLALSVQKAGAQEGDYMFDAAASEPAQLGDWVLLGTLYSGGKVNLDVVLDVPVTLGNEFKNSIGYLDWEFKVEERPLEPGDPQPPKTGDPVSPWLWGGIMVCAAAGMIWLLAYKRKKKEA